MKKTAILLMLITILSKVIGFIREVVLSYFYGASNVSDAYLISVTIPTVIFGFIGIAVSTGYIPMYSKILKEFGQERANKFTSNLLNVLMLLCTLLVGIGLVLVEPLVRLFASGFKGETLALAISFTRISIWTIYFTGMVYIYNGYLQLKGNYIIPALIGFPMNLCIILFIIISSKVNPTFLAVGSLVAAGTQILLLAPFIIKSGFRYNLKIDSKDPYMKEMFFLALPTIIGMSVNQLYTVVDQTIASRIAIGGISALNYASRLNGFVQGIVVVSIVTALYPLISKMAAEHNMDGLKKSISEATIIISLLVLPATVGFMIFAGPIVKLLFARGAFDTEAILMTKGALFFYSIGMVAYGFREVLSRAFFALQDTKTPMINAIIALVTNIILNVILSRFMGINGLALATSISAIFCTGLLFISLRKKLGPFGIKHFIITFIKILGVSLVMGMVSKIAFNYLILTISQNLSLVVSIGIGALVYFAAIYFMRIEDVDLLVNALKSKIKKSAA